MGMCLSVHHHSGFCFPYSLVSLTCPQNTAQSSSEVVTYENWESWAACVLLDPLVKLIKESITNGGIHPQGLERKHPDPSFTWEYDSGKMNIFQFLLTEAQFWEVTIKDEAENYNWVFRIDKLYYVFWFFFILNSPLKVTGYKDKLWIYWRESYKAVLCSSIYACLYSILFCHPVTNRQNGIQSKNFFTVF